MKLKSLIIIAVSLFSFSGCGPTQEEKSQSMAANYLKGVLYHFDSYNPLQTKVDNSFVSLSTDEEVIKLTLDMLNLFQSAQEYVDKIECTESSMEIWSPSGIRLHSVLQGKRRTRYNQQLLDKTKDRIQNQFSKIKEQRILSGNRGVVAARGFQRLENISQIQMP